MIVRIITDTCRQEKTSSFADHVHDSGKESRGKTRDAIFTRPRFGGDV